ncbi:nitroreductase family protein [Anaerosolibacter sp.]|uniref:nitroreductase family protein n=1 Tax=Anaerosolibacter sp. TaxID=1872527 RepID=UPI0039EEFFC6
MGKVFEAILKRRSIRKYKSEEVPQDKIKKVLEAANWAPSNGNSQPWCFIVTKGEYVNRGTRGQVPCPGYHLCTIRFFLIIP